ncbi:polyphosphate:AMP phosphotransferase [Sulfidibacter corallicola]|uniref:Polyphosphate:AMP phosphotransferase n=1 Tax=Sulfidibacter corallicola TaxID=2818388 RepID=A0A8A4TVF8_SULCO|nr:polyphosphate:AMP phosphotransferase [Sulfidibacter corallicola]QTD53158.1 polyphosphate:AMP phosphotransferase [Sulfidibacter corallicola]
MLTQLDMSVSMDKATYQQQVKDLMTRLRLLQHQCWEEKLPMVVVLEGWAAAGKGSLVKKMTRYMDPRGFQVHPIWPATEEERKYPFMWRFWQKLPARGKLGIFYHSWYTRVLEDRLFQRIEPGAGLADTVHINGFERLLSEAGYAIAKFWIQVDKKVLRTRLKEYGDDPLQSWRVRDEDWGQVKRYGEYRALAEEMLAKTSTGWAPWTLVEGNCPYWSRIKVLQTVTAVLAEALERKQSRQNCAPKPATPPIFGAMEPNHLARVDLTRTLDEAEYEERLAIAQMRLYKLQRKIFKAGLPVLILFEGWDAAGKGGAIKRLTDILDPRSFAVHTFSAPTPQELALPYLHRFWKTIPAKGQIAIFDRTWYGRVLVERIEGFATEEEWRRAYREINEAEAQLCEAGVVLVKFWLHIDREEQLRRFEARRDDDFKNYKLTDEDWRNREKWDPYEVAVNQMIQRTSTVRSPWTLVAGNDKRHARVKVIETVAKAIKDTLKALKARS